METNIQCACGGQLTQVMPSNVKVKYHFICNECKQTWLLTPTPELKETCIVRRW